MNTHIGFKYTSYLPARFRRENAPLVSCKSFRLGKRIFHSKAACQNHVRRILHYYQPGAVIPDPDREDVLQLLLLHPRPGKKIGKQDIHHFTVATSRFGTRCFMLVRMDGTTVDFSSSKCLLNNGAASGGGFMRSEVSKAMRMAVSDQVTSFRKAQFKEAEDRGDILRCPLSGTPLTTSTCHVDHVAPYTFKALQGGWMAEQGLSSEDIELVDSDKLGSQVMASPELLHSWQRYHMENARLRLLSPQENMGGNAG